MDKIFGFSTVVILKVKYWFLFNGGLLYIIVFEVEV